ncbi:unnamed protein product [Mucor hiemalis]
MAKKISKSKRAALENADYSDVTSKADMPEFIRGLSKKRRKLFKFLVDLQRSKTEDGDVETDDDGNECPLSFVEDFIDKVVQDMAEAGGAVFTDTPIVTIAKRVETNDVEQEDEDLPDAPASDVDMGYDLGDDDWSLNLGGNDLGGNNLGDNNLGDNNLSGDNLGGDNLGGDNLGEVNSSKRQLKLAHTWRDIFSTLVDNYVIFRGEQTFPSTETKSPCELKCTTHKNSFMFEANVQVFFFHCVKAIKVNFCSCYSLPAALISMGLFPATPGRPRQAFCFGLLDFFQTVKNTLKVSGQGIADLYNNLQDVGEQVLLDDDMCRSVMYLYSKLKLDVEEKLNSLAEVADLGMNCPACPEASSADKGDRLFLTMDGNFSQKCKKEITFYDEENNIPLIEGMWVEKGIIDGVENVIPSREALESENHFKAAGAGTKKSNQYPVTGLFACVCPRHEIVRKLADMDTGEGFKYPSAILRTLLSGANAPHHKVLAMYDIACLYEQAFKNELESLDVQGKLALPIFHAYAHVGSCQALRNPRNLVEFGRTDGEATERLWSDLNPFVRSTRSMLQSNRKLVLGQAIRFRNEQKKMNLGNSLVRRYRNAAHIISRMEKKLIHLDDDFPGGYGDVTKFYLLQALLSRFMLHHVRHHPDLSAANLGFTNLADAAERVERDVPLTQFEDDLGISVAGEMFLLKQAPAIGREIERLKGVITVPLVNDDKLSCSTFHDAASDWIQFLERKKLLFKEVLRSNVLAYYNGMYLHIDLRFI